MQNASLKLLTREAFKTHVFNRDKHTCVFCNKPAVDAHHIIDRKLWTDGGYYLENGASVCEHHHMECELTHISVPEVWKACGIQQPAIPPQLPECHEYDKWGNPCLDTQRRLKGAHFYDENVQKILLQAKKLHLFDTGIVLPLLPQVTRQSVLAHKLSHTQQDIAVYKIHTKVLTQYEAKEDLPDGWCYTGPLLWNSHMECVNAYDTEEWNKLIGKEDKSLVFHGKMSHLDVLGLPSLKGSTECYLLKESAEILLKLFHREAITFA